MDTQVRTGPGRPYIGPAVKFALEPEVHQEVEAFAARLGLSLPEAYRLVARAGIRGLRQAGR